ncbi:hypothetical protein [uncultured Veillonella sp.]|uniref:hypothetical protein n=1 Tax=uncultured Veillonella sp. TaxID=159268 RepID=UPI002626EB5A|nr:hypothetical protein [uncultured Veillonella sp.]
MGYIKVEYTGNELDFRGNACSVIEYVAFACGVAEGVLGAITVKENDEELFEDMKMAIIEEIKTMEMKDYESNI